MMLKSRFLSVAVEAVKMVEDIKNKILSAAKSQQLDIFSFSFVIFAIFSGNGEKF